ncbi:MAG TPA: DUF4153 domain-containing protein [Pyrinomonadaceae bacterium]|nr:DUF4153 domain-containing protein [Pyrinomonadaceae bacterium]
MSEKTRLGLWVLGVGLTLGLAGDVLLRATPWGLNFALWVGALAAAALALKMRAGRCRDGNTGDGGGGTADSGRSLVGNPGSAPVGDSGRAFSGGSDRIFAGGLGSVFADEGAWALPCAFAFALAFAWRDSPALLALDALAVLALLSVALLGGRGGRVLRAGPTDYWLAGLAAGVAAAFAPLLLVGADVKWGEVPRRGWTRHAVAALRGLLIAVPLLLLFGGLFTAADAAYAGLVNRTFNLDPDLALSHLCLTLFFAWISAGYLRSLVLGQAGKGDRGARTARHVFGFYSDERPAPVVSMNLGAASGYNSPTINTGAARRGGAATDYRMPPPSVTELTGDAARPAPPSVVGEPPRPAGPEFAPEPAASTEPGAPSERAARAESAAPPDETANKTAGETGAAGQAEATRAAEPPKTDIWGGIRLGLVEVAVALGLLNALFVSFVAVQIRYLFGGAALVAETAGMTYAEYARRGFFELVWVAALVLPLLLAAHWLLRHERPAHERVFRLLAGGLLSMLFVVLASALWRMRLYQGEYGQTELRFYTTAFIGWLALVFVWFALTVLRGRRELFAFGALVAALAVLGALNFVNPSARIVRANAALARERGTFDAAYAASLGADAVPALLEAAPQLGRRDRAEVARRLLEQDWGAEDWRSWNLSRALARRAVVEDEAALRGWAPAPEPEAVPAPEPKAAPVPASPASPAPPAGAESGRAAAQGVGSE